MRSFKNLLYFLFVFIVFTSSCNSIRQSAYSEKNVVRDAFFINLFNDSLKVSMQLFGGKQIQNAPLNNYKKFTPKGIKKYFKKELKPIKKLKIWFYAYSLGDYFGYYYVGFIGENDRNLNTYKKFKSEGNSVFYEENGIQRLDSFLLKKYIIPLEDKSILFYCFKKTFSDQITDSIILQNNSWNELMTLRSLSNYIPFSQGKKDFLDTVQQASYQPGYAKPLNALLSLKKTNSEKFKQGILSQFLYTAYSFFDEIAIIRQLLFEQHTFDGNNILNRTSDTIAINGQLAIPKILMKADKQKILMFNESHYDWRHRYFVTLMLDSLYKKGYKYLCLETLQRPDSINKRGFPVLGDGYYVKEPFMGNLARSALNIGFKLIAYEDTTDIMRVNLFNSLIDKREYTQALNLYRQYKKDTAAKWIVLAGYSHINKESFNASEKSTMAKYFYELSGIEPFSINQSLYSDISNTKLAWDSSGTLDNYYYLRDDQVNDSILLKQSDLFIINNIKYIPFEKNNPLYGWKEHNIRYESGIQDKEYAIKVYLKNEYLQSQDPVPIYIDRTSIILYQKKIWLPAGKYYLIVTDKNDQLLLQSDLKSLD